jgi:DNA repair protein RecN (Recombination protein N)
MLSFLSIQNFLVIDRLEIDFDNSLNIITGETGAGKTIIIDALKVLLGERINKDYFRDHNKPVIIEACFSDVDKIPLDLKEIFGIESEVYIRREINYNGRNKILINNRYAALKDVKDITEGLIEISGQYENQKLLDKEYHLQYLDGLIDKNYLDNYKNRFEKYLKINKEYNKLLEEKDLFEKNREFLLFQKNELESANINIDEDLHIDEKIKRLTNIEQIKKEILTSLDCLKYGEINLSTLTSLTLKSIGNLKELFTELKEYTDILYEWNISCNELSNTLEKILSKIDTDVTSLDRLVERKFLLEQLKRKYKRELNELLELKKETTNVLASYYIKEDQLKRIEEELLLEKKELVKIACLLSEVRKNAANMLEKKIAVILDDIGLKGAVFKVIFNKLTDCILQGMDEVEFYISTNPGFEALSISKVASGGELSRIMLALKEIFSDIEKRESIIFDEVDTGISGSTAKKVAQKLKVLSSKKQLIVITHLPVIAATGSTHYHLVKREMQGKALTEIIKLSKTEREEVLATMIAGGITESSLYQAKELLGTKK